MEKSSALNEIKKLLNLVANMISASNKLNRELGTSFQACETPVVVETLDKCNSISKSAKLNKKFTLKKDKDFPDFMDSFLEYEEKLIISWHEKNELNNRMKAMEELERASHGDTWHLGRGID